MSGHFDVLIVGGGITGSSAAIFLQQGGYRTIIVEKSSLGHRKAGEALSPACNRFLGLMNVSFTPAEAVNYNGVSSKWGSNETQISDFLFNPYGCALVTDRAVFDRKLFAQAGESGALCLTDTDLRQLHFADGKWWVNHGISADYVIFATGRASAPSAGKSKKKYTDKLIALSAVVEEEPDQAGNFLMIESMDKGWFYTNVLPSNRRLLSIFTDGDLAGHDKARFFRKQLSKLSNYYSEISVGCEFQLDVFDARSSWTAIQSGKGWLALGDAAYNIDPLSGQGIEKNFNMIEYCIENFETAKHDHLRFQRDYRSFNLESFNRSELEKLQVYAMEQRWPGEEFWKRRR